MKFLFLFQSLILMASAAFSQNTPGSQLYPVSDHGVWGYINRDGDMVIASQYQSAHFFYEGLAAVKKEGKWGFIDSKNKMIIDPAFDTTLHFSEGWCAVGSIEEGMPLQWGYINMEGKSLASTEIPALGFATNFRYNRAMVSELGFDEPFFINKAGHRVIKQGEYYFITDDNNNTFNDGILKVQKPFGENGLSQTMFIDTAGKIIEGIALDYAATGSYKEGMMWFVKDMKYGFLDKTGREVIKAKYDTVLDFSEGWARVSEKMDYDLSSMTMKGGIHGYINQLGEWVLEPKARESWSFHDGYARVRDRGKWGYMNTNGTLIIPAEYDEAEDFFRGFGRAKKNGRWYYINTRGKVVWSEPED